MTVKSPVGWGLAALGLLLSTNARAATDPAACIQSVKEICAGLEDHVETCLAQHSAQFAPDCRDLLQSALSQAQSGTGVSVCVDDIKRFCSGVDAASLSACLTEKYAQFSPACQKSLDAANATAHH